jgi:hypothetical protein
MKVDSAIPSSQRSGHVAINPDSFVTFLVGYLETRLNSTAYTKLSKAAVQKKNIMELNNLVKSFCVLRTKQWLLLRVSYYGSDKIKYLANRFGVILKKTRTTIFLTFITKTIF